MPPSILERLKLSIEDLTQVVEGHPSLRGMIVGYAGEFQLRKTWFSDDRVSNVMRYDDHDRRHKNDLVITYRGLEISVEVKSLQSNTVRIEEGTYKGKFQCDASDRRKIKLPNGRKLETTCLLVGEFDILAVNLFEFRKQWDFVFALNRDLPRSRFRGYTRKQREFLLATLVNVQWPPVAPFVDSPFVLADRLLRERAVR